MLDFLRMRFWQAVDVIRGGASDEVRLSESTEAAVGVPSRPRILFVGLKHDYGFARRGLSFEETNFVHSLASMGFEVLRFDTGVSRRLGRGRTSRLLWETLIRYQPALMFTVLFRDELDPDRLGEISLHSGVQTLNWFCDDHWRFDAFSAHWAPRFHWVVTTYRPAVEWYRKRGYHHVILSQWGCNQFLYRWLGLPKRYDVSFVGQPHGDRADVIRTLRRAGIRVATWGAGWPAGRLPVSEMIRVFNETRVNLNLSNASRKAANQIKARDFEVPGCKGFLITGRAEGIEEYFKVGEEIVCYDGVDDLVDRVRYYLTHEEEREAIAEQGYQRALREHTYVRRFSDIFERIGISVHPLSPNLPSAAPAPFAGRAHRDVGSS